MREKKARLETSPAGEDRQYPVRCFWLGIPALLLHPTTEESGIGVPSYSGSQPSAISGQQEGCWTKTSLPTADSLFADSQYCRESEFPPTEEGLNVNS